MDEPGMTLHELISLLVGERLTPSSPTLIEIYNPTIYETYPTAATGRATR